MKKAVALLLFGWFIMEGYPGHIVAGPFEDRIACERVAIQIEKRPGSLRCEFIR